MRLSEFITESSQLAWNGDPVIGWWEDAKVLTMYHGTHLRNLDSILKNGFNKFDPQTGKISMAFEPNTAFGYASMSGAGGEANFRQAGAKVTNTPSDQRVVFVVRLPMQWVLSNMDPNLGGNLGTERKRLTNKAEYVKYMQQGGDDQSYYQLAELRFAVAIPAKYIIGYMQK
jgi:hypothetical protein